VDQAELLRIRDAMIRRGPDAEGMWISTDQAVGLGHRRLAIIDLSPGGVQPMSTADQRLHIVFNGEIYNYQALRASLQRKGHVFRTASDTEVLLHLYREYGRDMVQHLRGMYAFALWDSVARGMFLARDPFGIKPLYFADDGSTLRVASQVKALLQGGRVDMTPEPAGHVGFFLWGHVPEPYTLYRGIRALPAGSNLWVQTDGSCAIQPHFDLASEMARAEDVALSGKLPQARERLHAALLDSVKHHLIADVPVGVFLSAGLDSSTLASLAREAGVSDLRTVTLGFEEFRNTENDEVPLAENTARLLQTRHTTQWVTREDFDSHYTDLLASMDQPSIDGVNSYFVSKAAHDAGLKVVLSGLGGDELFGGYPSFRQIPTLVQAMQRIRYLQPLGVGARLLTAGIINRFTSSKYAGLLEYGGSYPGAYLLRRGLFMTWELPSVLDPQFAQQGLQDLDTLRILGGLANKPKQTYNKVRALETGFYMRNQLLRDADWAGMAHSLELRVPLVDIELFRAVLAVSPNPSKLDMAQAPAIPLPAVLLQRRKTGFSIPVRQWLVDTQAAGQLDRGHRAWAQHIYLQILSSHTVGTALRDTGNMRKKRVLVYRIGSLGDTCVAIPAFRLIRSRYLSADIRVLTNFPVQGGLKAAPLQAVLGDSGLVDGYFEYPLGFKHLNEFISTTKALANWHPDVLIYVMPVRNRWQLMRDMIYFNMVLSLPQVFGLSLKGKRQSQYQQWDKKDDRYESETQRLLRNIDKLGSIDLRSGAVWSLGLQAAEQQQADGWLDGWEGRSNFLVCSIGAKWASKDWGLQRWCDWAEQTSRGLSGCGLLLVGAAVEFDNSTELAAHWRGPVLNLCGQLPVRVSAAIIQRSRCFVGHDSGPMHLGAAVGVPCVAVFSAQDLPGVWFPNGPQHQVFYHQTECFGCRSEVCKRPTHECMDAIEVPDVVEATLASMGLAERVPRQVRTYLPLVAR